MWVVKLGGSLLKTCDLSTTLKSLADHGAGNVVIVPGGGVFADQVRYLQKELQIDDTTAHRMALRAMEQFGALLTTLDPRLHAAHTIEAINQSLEKKEIPVWFPYDMIANNPAIRATWDITSDSLALWLANCLKCQNLVMIKSVQPEGENYSAKSLSELGYLDRAFAEMITEMFVTPWWLFYEQIDRFFRLLDNNNSTQEGLKEIKKAG